MADNANILTLYPLDEQKKIDDCKALLQSRQLQFVQLENTFFIKTTEVSQVSDLSVALQGEDFAFTLLFVGEIDGSSFGGHNIKPGQITAILKLFNL